MQGFCKAGVPLPQTFILTTFIKGFGTQSPRPSQPSVLTRIIKGIYKGFADEVRRTRTPSFSQCLQGPRQRRPTRVRSKHCRSPENHVCSGEDKHVRCRTIPPFGEHAPTAKGLYGFHWINCNQPGNAKGLATNLEMQRVCDQPGNAHRICDQPGSAKDLRATRKRSGFVTNLETRRTCNQPRNAQDL